MKKTKKKENNKTLLFVGAIIVIACVILLICFINNKQDIYKFNFNDGITPGRTYNGEINLTNGKIDFAILYGCSLPDPSECPDDEIIKGTLNKEDLELVKNTLEKNNRKNNYFFILGVSYLIKGDQICNEETNETCYSIGKELIETAYQN